MMDYIVIDTEFSQPQPKLYNPNTRFRPNPVSPFEIIEIGAAKVNQDLVVTEVFSRLVKPVIYRKLSPIVIKKTGIKPADLEKGDGFRQVMKDFLEFCGSDILICTWSSNDVMILKRNCIYHKLPTDWIDNYYDIQKLCTKALGLPKSQAVGLKNALNAFEIEIDGKLHRAADDAVHTAKVFIKLYNEDLERKITKNSTQKTSTL